MNASNSASNEKPGIEELVGGAVHASALVIDPRRSETPLLRLAALGGAALQIAAGTDRPVHRPPHMSDQLWAYHTRFVPPPRPTRTDKLEASLAPLLWRMYAGHDDGGRNRVRAAYLLAEWLAQKPTWRKPEMAKHVPHLLAFAWQLIEEFLKDKCDGCDGKGEQELTASGRARRKKGTARVRMVRCSVCAGTGKSQPAVRARVEAMEIEWAQYKTADWPRHWRQGHGWLRGISKRLHSPTKAQLERK